MRISRLHIRTFLSPRRLPKFLILFISIVVIGGILFFGHVKVNRRIANYETRSDKATEDSPGEMGHAVPYSWFGKEESTAKAISEREKFNLMASDAISLQRDMPDRRCLKCQLHEYSLWLPSASIIIVFYNEPLSTLLRTIWSVINRTPPEYLHEILLLDDASEQVHLQSELEEYSNSHFTANVRLLRMQVHQGLIKGKLAGAQEAAGDVLVFLDSHCEVVVGWLEPLLHRITQNPKVVACPLLDSIKLEDMSYAHVGSQFVGIFTWSLYYKWYKMEPPELDSLRIDDVDFEPHSTPTFPGGLFAINREWFFEVGSYDEQMEGWGGENIEMSFRVWMCGGTMEFIPCSRVAHLNKLHTTNYTVEQHNHAVNSARLAEVWMGDYKRLFYVSRPEMEHADIGDLTERVALRERLQCHNFKWYLENVYQKFVPDEQSQHHGQLQNVDSNHYCLHTDQLDRDSASGFSAQRCVSDISQPSYSLQLFALSNGGELRREEWCIDSDTDEEGTMKLKSFVCQCDGFRIWTYFEKKLQLYNNRTGNCLEVQGNLVSLQPCSNESTQKWLFIHVAIVP